MTSNLLSLFRRGVIFGAGVMGSVLPALLLTNTYAQAGRYCATLLAYWVEFLIGPVKYWFPVLLGYPRASALHPMSGISIWVYAVCFILALAHPIKPRLLTAGITAGGFAIWYGWAFLTINAYEY